MDRRSTSTHFTARIDGEDLQVDAPGYQPLLDSLESGGVTWPSSCREGTCGTCIGRLKAGKVRYEMQWFVLSDQDVEDGFILPCIAFPESDVTLEGSSF
ncbi:MAG: 2Fe-2S iron-sulfur cluster-binding protein [Comamonadaceae bacterium]|nr:2Fe-2S iron-sulfur cluster binding domain-containing protein [Burkholderiales bacterium]MEB2349410.1 2Fe-2S iron-sulfur cluster-binding protein [Comamonadaceae bacterium]